MKLSSQKSRTQTKKRWWGSWEIETPTTLSGSSLEIHEVFKGGFEFSLNTSNGAHMGQISGAAQFISRNEAIFISDRSDPENKCEIDFTKTNDIIQVSESDGCFMFHGARATFNGDYRLNKDVFYYLDIVNDYHLTSLYSILTDKYWSNYIRCFSDIRYLDSLDGVNSKVITGGVPGLYTCYESILMVEGNDVWSAFLDCGKVYYLSSLKQKKLPKTIDNWMERFKECEILFLDRE